MITALNAFLRPILSAPFVRLGTIAVATSVVGNLISEPMVASVSQAATPAKGLEPFIETLPGSVVKVQMIPIPGGTIKIGNEMVTVKPFYIAKTETPWEAFDAFIASGPASKAYDQSAFAPDAIARPSKSYILPDLGIGHNGFPVINVSFTSVEMYGRWMASATKKKYRLPTEAEWELACRAGNNGPWKIDQATAEKSAWFYDTAEDETHAIAKKAPNKFGLYDMLGNVGEWATDLEGKPVLCGPTFNDKLETLNPSVRQRWKPSWQTSDPQIPKSRWWLADGAFCGFRLVCEP